MAESKDVLARFDGDIDLTDFLRALGRQWLLIAIVVLLSGASAFWLASRTPVQYETSANVVVLPLRTDRATQQPNAATIRALLSNLSLVSEVIGEAKPPDPPDPADFARDGIRVDDIPHTPLVRVRVVASEPAAAAQLTKLLIARGAARESSFARGTSSELARQLEAQIAIAADRLAEAGKRLLEYQHKHGIQRRGAALAPADTRGAAVLNEVALEQQLELARLETDYDAMRQVYVRLSTQRERALAEATASAPAFRLLDPDVAPGRPLSRGRARKTAIGLIVGALIGIALAVAREARRVASREPVTT